MPFVRFEFSVEPVGPESLLTLIYYACDVAGNSAPSSQSPRLPPPVLPSSTGFHSDYPHPPSTHCLVLAVPSGGRGRGSGASVEDRGKGGGGKIMWLKVDASNAWTRTAGNEQVPGGGGGPRTGGSEHFLKPCLDGEEGVRIDRRTARVADRGAATLRRRIGAVLTDGGAVGRGAGGVPGRVEMDIWSRFILTHAHLDGALSTARSLSLQKEYGRGKPSGREARTSV